MIKIVIPGPPVSYHKELFAWKAKDGRTGISMGDRASYKNWRFYARGRAAEICEGMSIAEGPFEVTIRAYFLPPKSLSKKQLALALAGLIRPLKLDCDNIAKAVADSCLTGIVMRDDRQIVSLHVEKYYDASPRVEVEASVAELRGKPVVNSNEPEAKIA